MRIGFALGQLDLTEEQRSQIRGIMQQHREEFRALRLGRLAAWVAAAALAASFVTQLVSGQAWQPAEDVLFVLAGAFLIQAFAVVHGLRGAGVIGSALVGVAYAALLVAPMALVGFGFADTWVRFRERFGAGRGPSQG